MHEIGVRREARQYAFGTEATCISQKAIDDK